MQSIYQGQKISGASRHLLLAAMLTGVVGLLLSAIPARAATPDLVPLPGTIIFYTAALTTIGAFFLFNVALNNRVGVYYAALFAAMLALVWFLEGGLTALALGIGQDLERSAGMTIGLAGIAFGFFTAERAIDFRHDRTWVRRAFLTLSFVSAILIFGAWLWPFEAMALVVDSLLLIMVACHFVATLTWRTSDGRPLRLPAIAALALLLAIVALFLIYFAGGGTLNVASLFRWLFALVVIPAMAAIGTALIDIRRSRDVALEAALVAARKDAEMSASLLEMEKNYTHARDVAANRSRQIATASHDIRQPIAAMRAELDGLKGEIATENADRLTRILNHFDALTEELSRSSHGAQELSPVEDVENVPASILFSTLARMFATEARSKGIELRFVRSSKIFYAPAVVLMRLGANLLSNAIHHSKATRILVGIRSQKGRLQLNIIDDGIGFSATGIANALSAGVKGAESNGSGLGLSIVRELTSKNGFALRYQSSEGNGAAFSISIPKAE